MNIHKIAIVATYSILMLRKIILNYGKSKTKTQIFILLFAYYHLPSFFTTLHCFTSTFITTSYTHITPFSSLIHHSLLTFAI